MKKLFVFLGIVLSTVGSAVSAQEVTSTVPMQKSSWGDAETSEDVCYIPDISLDMRGGFRLGSEYEAGRFTGDDLNIDINGYISPNFSYSLNHRIASSYYGEASWFDATNWLTLTYETDNFSITAGKDALLMGSFEYDAYDLDAYYEMNSPFYNDFDCWQWGISGAWYPADDHEVLLQIANSPYSFDDRGYSFAAGWRGAWDWYESYWTTNLWMTGGDGLVKGVNLGNRFYLGNFTIDLDLMGRFNEIYGGWDIILSPSYQFGEWGRLFAKAGAEPSGFSDDLYIFLGGGFEYFPLKENKNIRLHAAYTYNEYTVGHLLNIGLTWKMNLTNGIKKLFGVAED
ncbi:MAG: hypothetical protein J6V17_02730 [Bacteroidales bacterium]|nr:hypothetical protein [Bacteroidales bacterium]